MPTDPPAPLRGILVRPYLETGDTTLVFRVYKRPDPATGRDFTDYELFVEDLPIEVTSSNYELIPAEGDRPNRLDYRKPKGR